MKNIFFRSHNGRLYLSDERNPTELPALFITHLLRWENQPVTPTVTVEFHSTPNWEYFPSVLVCTIGRSFRWAIVAKMMYPTPTWHHTEMPEHLWRWLENVNRMFAIRVSPIESSTEEKKGKRQFDFS